jgi:protein subunit release factor B
MKQKILSISKKDLEIQTFRSGGKGGQNQNKVESGVRIIHKVSGAVGEARDSRDQYHNKKVAFERMYNSIKFQNWLKIEVARKL